MSLDILASIARTGAELGEELVFGDDDDAPVLVPSVVEDEIHFPLKFLRGNPLLALLLSSTAFDSSAATLVATFDGIPVLPNADFEEGGYLTIECSRVIFTRWWAPTQASHRSSLQSLHLDVTGFRDSPQQAVHNGIFN